jgi:hypothetical protein
MAANQRVAGLIQLQTNGEVLRAKGAFTWNLGKPKREPVVGADGVHGYKETPQVPFIEGAITDAGDIDGSALVTLKDATVNLKLGNGKMIVLNKAWYAGEGTGNTEESEMAVRWEGDSAEEVSA